jgi:hypothetical protein
MTHSPKRLSSYWNKYWRVPKEFQADVHALFVAWAIVGLTLLWLGFQFFGINQKVLSSVLPSLPSWFLFANLFLAPILVLLAAGPLSVPLLLRLALLVLMFCSLSAPTVLPEHQLVSFIMLAVLYVEAFWLVPKLNRWANRSRFCKNGGAVASDEKSRMPTTKSRMLDIVIYIGIAGAFASLLLCYILRQ